MSIFIIFKTGHIIVKTRSNITSFFFILSQNHLSRTVILSVIILIIEKPLVKILNEVGTSSFSKSKFTLKNRSLCRYMKFVSTKKSQYLKIFGLLFKNSTNQLSRYIIQEKLGIEHAWWITLYIYLWNTQYCVRDYFLMIRRTATGVCNVLSLVNN